MKARAAHLRIVRGGDGAIFVRTQVAAAHDYRKLSGSPRKDGCAYERREHVKSKACGCLDDFAGFVLRRLPADRGLIPFAVEALFGRGVTNP